MDNAFHIGRYTPTEAARLVGLNPQKVRRWLATSPSFEKGRGPVVRHPSTSPNLLSFLDLVELYMADALLKQGASYRGLREKLQEAAHRLRLDHPLARKCFLLDGDALFLPDDPIVTELGTGGQLALGPIVRHHAKTIDFSPEGLATRWLPLGQDRQVVIDPLRGFGAPTARDSSVKTSVLYDAWLAEDGDHERVAETYQVPVEAVKDAVDLELKLAA